MLRLIEGHWRNGGDDWKSIQSDKSSLLEIENAHCHGMMGINGVFPFKEIEEEEGSRRSKVGDEKGSRRSKMEEEKGLRRSKMEDEEGLRRSKRLRLLSSQL